MKKTPKNKLEIMKRYYQKNKKEILKRNKLWRLRNPEKLKKIVNEYYQKNKDAIFKKKKSWRLKNKEEILSKKREDYNLNKEKYKKRNKRNWIKHREKYLISYRIYGKKYYEKNKKVLIEKDNKYKRKRRKEDIQFRLKTNLRRRLLYALTLYGNGKNFSSLKYGINYKKIINHLKPFPKEISKYHVDHIIPLCTFDLTDPKQILKAFAPENHQWLTIEENLSKGGK